MAGQVMSTEWLRPIQKFRTRVYLLLTILVILVMGAAASVFLISQNRALEEALTKRGQSLTESLAQGVRLGLILEDVDFISQTAAGLLGLPDMLFVDFYRPDGQLLLRLGQFDHNFSVDAADFRAAMNSKMVTRSGVLTASGNQEPYREFLTLVNLEDEVPAGFIRVGLATRAISEKWEETLKATVWTTLLLIVLTGMAAYFPVRRITHPLKQLADGALEIGQGNLDFRIELDSQDEIGELARNFNTMARSLQERDAEIKRKAKALETSELKYRELFEGIGQALYICDMDGKLLDCNQAMVDLFGYESREEMIESVQMGSDIYADPGRRPVVVNEALQRDGVRGLELEFKKKNGDRINALVTSGVRRDDKGKAIGFEGMIQDITEVRQLENQLIQSQKMESIGRLAGGVAHDFNNILSIINGYAQLALMEMEDDHRFREHIETIYDSGRKAANLTKQLLAFSRKQIIQPVILNLNVVIETMRSMLERLIGENIEIEIKPGDDLWDISADPTQIDQIIMNLAVNARDAMPTGGRLVIETMNISLDSESAKKESIDGPGQYLMLAISDTGRGMSGEVRARIFEPFFTTKEVGKGTGLGLATVYGIVKQNNGYIYVYSEPDMGTTFKIYLPRIGVDTDDLMFEQPEELPGGRETILLVEDYIDVREFALKVLSKLNYKVLVAEDGAAALKICDEFEGRIDLLLTDVVMPRMNGNELAEHVSRLQPGARVLYMSGYTEETIAHHGVLKKGINLLQKPLTPQVLAMAVREVLDTGTT